MRNTLLCILFLLPLFAQNSIEDKLTNDKADWNFTNTPFIEAIDTIRDAHKINILFAHKIKEKINFRVRDMKLRQALNLFCKVYDLTYSIQGNILFIFSSQQHELQYGFEKIETKVYDLRQMSFSVPNDIKFLQLRDKVLLPHNESELIEFQEEKDSPNAIFENFKEAIQYAVEPNSWDKDPISIDIVEGHGLVIVQTQSVHRQIQQFLKDLRQFSSVAIDVKVWQVSLPNEVLNEWQLYKKSSISQEKLQKIIANISPQDVWLQTQFSTSSYGTFPIHNKQQKNSYYEIHPACYDEQHVWLQIFQVTAQHLHETQNEETLLFYNTQSNFLMKKNTVVPIVISPQLDERSVVTFVHLETQGKPTPQKKTFREMSEEEQLVRQQLRNKTFDMHFRNSSLQDVAQFLTNQTGVNVVVKQFEEGDSKNINLIFKDVNAENILNILGKIMSVDYHIVYGAVVIFEKGAFSTQTQIELYDVSNFYLSDIEPPTSNHEDLYSGALFEASDNDPGYYGVVALPVNTNSLQRLIKSNIEINSWDENNVAIAGWGHLLIIRQTPKVHKQINNFLIDLQQSMAKSYQRIHLWMCVGKTVDSSQKICALTTSNRRKVVLKSGQLIMGKTVQDLELRRDFIRGHAYAENLQDHIDKRQSWEMTATPLLRDDTIEIKMNWVWRDKDMFKRHFKIAVKDGKTLLVTSLTPELNLYVGASIVK